MENLIAFLTLSALEIVLGIDNIVFIAIISNALPEAIQSRARKVGLLLAMGTRILLLVGITWVMPPHFHEGRVRAGGKRAEDGNFNGHVVKFPRRQGRESGIAESGGFGHFTDGFEKRAVAHDMPDAAPQPAVQCQGNEGAETFAQTGRWRIGDFGPFAGQACGDAQPDEIFQILLFSLTQGEMEDIHGSSRSHKGVKK